ncbi:MCE family protein [Saccharopolyspora taberi]|uniref:MCE family protein n=1 Tax=Saccharopolyspora taberi TaxID=60895 RepID=A0ABN3V2M3_9PSEU
MTPLSKLTALACALVLLLGGVLWWSQEEQRGTRITAYFGAAVGMYPGSDVRVLGMKVGSVTHVLPEGTQVRVDMLVEPDIAIPADARAVATASGLVSDRYVQLTPVYREGPEIGDGAVIPRERTATPVEVDELARSLDELAVALGPDGANREGDLSAALDTAARNLDGNGQRLGETIRELGAAASTLSGSQEDLFASVDQLRTFTRTLADSDELVRGLGAQLADATGFLAGEREELAAALAQLGPALTEVRGFVEDNRESIRTDVDDLAEITSVLGRQRSALAELLDVIPAGLSNLNNAYDPASGTLGVRVNPNELNHPPVVILCKALRRAAPGQLPPELAATCDRLAPVLDGVPPPAELLDEVFRGDLPPLPLGGGR